MRDCQIIGPDCTVAQFDRIYVSGKKNHFDLVPKNLEEKKALPSSGRKLGQIIKETSSDDEEEDATLKFDPNE